MVDLVKWVFRQYLDSKSHENIQRDDCVVHCLGPQFSTMGRLLNRHPLVGVDITVANI